ncbi:MAG: sugar ABC transporter permease [Ruminococcaceae bacterium]|nr:sugar ABC transporter permease [Oscillospiraceae bacterium]
MNLLRSFGVGTKKILQAGNKTTAIVMQTKTCYWLKVNTKAVRIGPMDGAQFPHVAHFTYTVDGVEYKGSRFYNWNVRCPLKGETITVYYDSSAPQKYAVRT